MNAVIHHNIADNSGKQLQILAYPHLDPLKIKDSQLRYIVDDKQSVVWFICHRIPEQTVEKTH